MQCIEVVGRKNTSGYGQTAVRVGPMKEFAILAHRLLFEQTWGITLQPGQVVRHACDNPACVNPLHLMVGTQQDNIRDMLQRGRHGSAVRTHCIRGHLFDEANTHLDKRGKRQCRSCWPIRRAARRAVR
jgi:hypothetical protein